MKSLFPEYFYTFGYLKKFIKENHKKLELINFGFVLLVFSVACLFAAITTCIVSCEPRSEYYYRDINLRVVSINGECSLTNDKFHKPQLCNIILFETLDTPTKFMEINTCSNNAYYIHIDTPWIYNHQPGDTVHFDYLLKSRFFEIRKR